MIVAMALWQFKFMLIPSEWATTNANSVTRHLADEGWDLGAAWRESARRETPEAIIDQYMPRAQSWHSDMTAWGNEKTDDIQLWREAGEINELQIRIDVRKDCSIMVQHSVAIARSLGCSFLLMEAANVIEPSAEQLVSGMKASIAMRFTLDPMGTLENLRSI